MLLYEPYVHQSVAHWEAKPRAKTVGVAHSSYRPILVLWFSSTLVVLWILLLSLVTVGCVWMQYEIKSVANTTNSTTGLA
jgi:hypothetical protein